jgi:hypothetical protein
MEDLYGFARGDLAAIRSEIEACLDIQMVLHDSSFRAGDYYLARFSQTRSLILQRNYSQSDGTWEYNANREAIALFIVSADSLEELDGVQHQLRSCIPDLIIIRRRTLGSDGRLKVQQWIGNGFSST